MAASHIIRTHFGKETMSTPAAATSREYLLTSEHGAYAASTICGCNTRKYHGLLVVPQPGIDNGNHVLLSSLDEKVISEDTAWRLSTHHYTDTFYPDGYRYIHEFQASPYPQWIFCFGNTVIKKELLLADNANQLLVKYTLIEAPGEVILCLMPLLAFRGVHTVTKMQMHCHSHVTPITGGISVSMHEHYPPVYLQLSGNGTCIGSPDWYYDFEYPLEKERGYYPKEDLFTPVYFSISLVPGQSPVFSAGLEESQPDAYPEQFNKQLKNRAAPETFTEYLQHAARQFIIQTTEGCTVRAGYYWFDTWGRDTCIALPGLTLLTGNDPCFTKVTDNLLTGLKDGLLPNMVTKSDSIYNTIDASLWLIWALQQYVHYRHVSAEVWNNYGKHLKSILHHYKSGTHYGIRMEDDGLITGGQEGYSLTWMDAIVNGTAVTPRTGKPVEINALWYNAICFCLQLALEAKDEAFISEWGHYPRKLRQAFVDCYWDPQKKYLADCVNGADKDRTVRPNQLLAVSLPYSPLTVEMQAAVMNKVRDELLTPRGLRSLSAADPQYCGHYGGDQPSRDSAYHQGTVWPWLLAHFAEGYLKVYKQEALPFLKEIYTGMTAALDELCLYSIAELYEGDHPHKAGGAVAQAWSVAELLRMNDVLNQYEQLTTINGTDERYTMETRPHL